MKHGLVVFLLCISMSAAAQNAKAFSGFSLAYQWIDGLPITGLMLQGGAMDFGGGVGARANVGIGLSQSYLELGADALVPFSNDRLQPYAGLGANYLSASGTSFFGLRGLVGVNYASSLEVAFFAEIAPTLFFVNDGTTFGIPLRFGVNYQFR